jgi:predicted alternative tryptophan synthase beta-subunit
MRLENAIKKLKKEGFEGGVKKERSFGVEYEKHYYKINTQTISFSSDKNGEIEVIFVTEDGDVDNLNCDYVAGTWCENLSRAIALAKS